MLYEIVDQFPNDMLLEEGGSLISLYLPTHRSFPENKIDPIEFKNLLREIANSLKQKNETAYVDTIMKPFYQLENDSAFWNNTLDGIAVFANKNKCIVYKLNVSVKKFAVVSNNFHIKPLILAFQSVENYQILGLSGNNFSLFQGNRYGFTEIEIKSDVPRTLEDVLGRQKTAPSLIQGAFGGTGNVAVYHGQGDKKTEDNKDTEKYFRYVDRYVYDNFSNVSKLPLILVSVSEYHTSFKNLSINPYLSEQSIDCSFDSIETEHLKTKILEISTFINQKKTEIIVNAYKKAESEAMGSSDLLQVAKAVFESRVETILLEENRIISGKIDSNTGKIIFGDIINPDYGDILSGLAELVIIKKGNVLIVSKDKMPCSTGVAAIFRYN